MFQKDQIPSWVRNAYRGRYYFSGCKGYFAQGAYRELCALTSIHPASQCIATYREAQLYFKKEWQRSLKESEDCSRVLKESLENGGSEFKFDANQLLMYEGQYEKTVRTAACLMAFGFI